MRQNVVKVAGANDIAPGKMKRVEVKGRAILIVNVDGTHYAVDDTCTHEDASLSLGSLKGELVSCALHGSRFNVRTGKPQEEPATEPLRTYSVRAEGDGLFVDLT